MSTAPATTRTPLGKLSAWNELKQHANELREKHLRELFASDPARGGKFCMEAEGIYLDYAKNRITDQTMKLLLELANFVTLGTPLENIGHLSFSSPERRTSRVTVQGCDLATSAHGLQRRARALRQAS